MYEELFPKKLANLRNTKGISARELSISLGQNPGYINNIESGKALPSMTMFFKICDYMHISPSDFLEKDLIKPRDLTPFK